MNETGGNRPLDGSLLLSTLLSTGNQANDCQLGSSKSLNSNTVFHTCWPGGFGQLLPGLLVLVSLSVNCGK